LLEKKQVLLHMTAIVVSVGMENLYWPIALHGSTCMQGDGPTGVIDHLDGVKTNNAISNLRDATPAENRANSRQKRSRSGIAGIQRADNKWEVCVRRKNLRYRLGHYDTIPEAEAVLSSIWTSTGERG
jgi:hypothetical protein